MVIITGLICTIFGHRYRLDSCDRDALECEDLTKAQDHLICTRCGHKKEIPCVLGE